jgi:uncharacterized protein YigA (DUF484 family)
MTQARPSLLNANEVVSYLRQHPDFFQEHLDLLELMHIPHPSGNAVSLITKQLEIVRSKHHELEKQLTGLIAIARENDTSFNRLHQLTLTLLDASTLEQVVINLNAALADFFSTDFIAIRFIQPPMAGSVLSDLFIAPDDSRLHCFIKELADGQPFCGKATDAQTHFLFAERASEVKSCAIIPMIYPRLNAILAIGSREATGFHADMGSIFLTQISEIVATRLALLLPAAR